MRKLKPIHISVVIPAHNASRFITETIKSVLNQSYPASEILVIDDGSDDSTRQIVSHFRPKVKLVHQERKGVSCARNHGISIARGDWLAFLDSDDIWLEKKLANCAVAIENNPSTVFLFSDFERFGDETGRCSLEAELSDWKPGFNLLVPTVCVLPSAAVVKRSFDVRFPEWAGNECEDAIYFNELSTLGSCLHLNEVLVKYRRHKGSAQKQAGSREKGCTNLWNKYSQSKTDRDMLIETLFCMIERKRAMRSWDDYDYYWNFLRKRWPYDRKYPLKMRFHRITKIICKLKDKLDETLLKRIRQLS